LKRNYFSSLKLPKQQSTSFWSQGILGIKHGSIFIYRLANRSKQELFKRKGIFVQNSNAMEFARKIRIVFEKE
jgi:hypothetical protein